MIEYRLDLDTRTSMHVPSRCRDTRMCFEQLLECFDRQTCLLDDGFQGPALEVSMMKREGYPEMRLVRMLEDMVAAGRVVHKQPGPLQDPEDLSWPEHGEPSAQTVSSTTFTCSFTGSSRMGVSVGMGSPSLCRLSREARMASLAISRASSRVSPSVTKPGKAGQVTT
jgi:hypothetical protein